MHIKINDACKVGALTVIFILTTGFPLRAWNIPAHMLSGALAYQILQRESPSTIAVVKTALESHPWFESHWRAQLEKLPAADRDEMFFMLAARWADDIRTKDRSQNRGPWHYINLPFKPEGQPDSVRTKPPAKVNILTALTENERIAKNGSTRSERSIALTWLFHLVGDVHQPLHTSALFTVDYPDGDRGGNEICARPAPNRKAIDLHRFWDGVIMPSSNITRLRNEAIALRNRPGFARDALSELGSSSYETWAKESFEIATKIAYLNGAVLGTPKGSHKDCSDVDAAVFLLAIPQ